MNRSASLLAFLMLLIGGPAFAQDEEIEEAAITKLPEILEVVEATYPPVALKQRISAQVALEIEISETGTVSDILVTSTTTIAETLSSTTAEAYGIVRSSTITDYGFDAAAVSAVRQMKFSPAEAEGIPIPVRVPFSYAFDLPPLAPLPPPPEAADPDRPRVVAVKGLLRERGTRTRIPGVILTIFRQREGSEELEAYEAVSNEEGAFAFYDLQPGKWRLQGEADGYYPLRDTLQVVVNQVTEVTYFLEKGSYSPYDVLVEVDPIKREVNRRTLTREEIRTVPGTLGDPILVVENLPGVARPAAGSGNIIVRGSGTNDTIVYVDGVEVPLIYHFGGLKSVLPIDVVETVDFYPGNFSAYYGRGTGGVFDAHIRRLDPDQLHGTLEISALDISLFAETPIGENAAMAVAGRRSVIGDVITAAVPDDANVGIVAAPVYYDGQILANWTPKPGHDLRFFFLASDDTLEFLFANTADVNPQLTNNQVNTAVNFQRATLEYRAAPSETFQNTMFVVLGRNLISFQGGGFAFRLESLQFQYRQTARLKLLEGLTLRAGADIISSVTDVTARLPGSPPTEGQTGGTQDLTTVTDANQQNVVTTEIGHFLELEWKPTDKLSIFPGIRLDYFSLVDQWSADPRLVARYDFSDLFALKGGVGVVYQQPQAVETTEEFGNPNLGLQRGIQYSLGTEFGFDTKAPVLADLRFDFTLFYKDLGDFVTGSDRRGDDGRPLFFDNTAIGRVYGLEAFIEHKFANNFRAWISYTLSRSERRDTPDSDFRLFDFDQTHIFNMTASYVLPEGWELGLRARFISGNPTTPSATFETQITQFFDDIDSFSNVPGAVNSARLPLFAQLDLRVEKSWTFDFFRFKAFLSIINTWNQENPEGVSSSFDFLQQEFATGLPVFPNVGVRAEF